MTNVRFLATAVTGALVIGAAGHSALPQQRPTFSVTVDLVRVDVLVTSKNGAVPGLTARDFELRDNGVPQEINDFQVGGTQAIPLSVLFVFDTSQSMEGSPLQRLAEAGRAVLDRLRPADQAGLVTFSEGISVRRPPSHDLDTVRQGLSHMTASGRTALYDALYAGVNLPRPPETRSMILLFSDGADNSSWLDAEKVRYAVRQSDSVIYSVGLDSTVRDRLQALSDETGGGVVIADSPNHLQALFLGLLAEMQSRYLLSYYPKNVQRDGWHTLDVRLRSRKHPVRARRGYYVTPR